MKNLFDEKKAAQVAAYFLFRANGRLPVLKLMKLQYLAERRSFEKFGEPMIGDKLVSMPHGPVLSLTFNHVNGELNSIEGGWDTWISERLDNDVELRDPSCIRSPEEDLLELSDADLEILAEIWERFGHMNKWQLRDYTHAHCPEWKDPEGSMLPILLEDLLSALDYSKEQTEELRARLAHQVAIDQAFSRTKH